MRYSPRAPFVLTCQTHDEQVREPVLPSIPKQADSSAVSLVPVFPSRDAVVRLTLNSFSAFAFLHRARPLAAYTRRVKLSSAKILRMPFIVRSALLGLVVWCLLALTPQFGWLGPISIFSEIARSFPDLLLAVIVLGAVVAGCYIRSDARIFSLTVLILCATTAGRVCLFFYRCYRGPAMEASVRSPTSVNLKIVVANAEFGRHSASDLKLSIGNELPSLILVTEATFDWLKNSIFNDLYSHRAEFPGRGPEGTVLFSSYPLVDPKMLDVAGGFHTIITKIQIDEKAYCSIVAVHAPPPQTDVTLEHRRRYYSAVENHLTTLESGCVVVLGDFNTTPLSSSYVQLLSNNDLRNAGEGFGYLKTWRFPRLPSLGAAIDHVLVSKGITVSEYRLLPSFGSDHYPLLAEIHL